MKAKTDEFINMNELKSTIKQIKDKKGSADYWNKISEGFEVVASAIETIAPAASKMQMAATGLLGIAYQGLNSTKMAAFTNHEALNTLFGDLAVTFAATSIGTYAVMTLASKVAHGLNQKANDKIFNFEVLVDKAKRITAEMEVGMAVNKDENQIRSSKAILNSLTKGLFDNDLQKLQYQNEFMYNEKVKRPKLKM